MEKNSFLRIRDICGDCCAGIPAMVPVARSTWWVGVKSGKFPQPVKLGGRITVWRASDIAAFIDGPGNDAA